MVRKMRGVVGLVGLAGKSLAGKVKVIFLFFFLLCRFVIALYLCGTVIILFFSLGVFFFFWSCDWANRILSQWEGSQSWKSKKTRDIGKMAIRTNTSRKMRFLPSFCVLHRTRLFLSLPFLLVSFLSSFLVHSDS